jgi:hypothetical protein
VRLDALKIYSDHSFGDRNSKIMSGSVESISWLRYNMEKKQERKRSHTEGEVASFNNNPLSQGITHSIKLALISCKINVPVT